MLDTLQQFTESLPEFLQWLGVALAGAIPFVESYFGSALGVLAGVNPVVAVLAASAGNFITVFLVVVLAHSARARVTQGRAPKPVTPKRERLRRAFDKWGVPGVCLVGPTILASQITSAALISFGAPRQQVLVWQAVSILAWGIAFGVVATLGLTAVQA